MLTDDALTVICAIIFSGSTGACFAYILMKNSIRKHKETIEHYWNSEVKRLNLRIDSLTKECVARNVSLCEELSTKTVGNVVNKSSYFSHSKPRD